MAHFLPLVGVRANPSAVDSGQALRHAGRYRTHARCPSWTSPGSDDALSTQPGKSTKRRRPLASEAVLVPLAVGTGVVVIVVAIAVVLIVLIVAASTRGRQKRQAERRAEGRSAPSAGPAPHNAEH